MNITVVGTGYVGLVTGACLAEMGNHVVCLDLDPGRIATLLRGELPIHEPGLLDIVLHNTRSGRLAFTRDVDHAVAHGRMQFIAVGTPADEDGSADLQHVLAAARAIAERMQEPRLIVNKSTVPVGTADPVRELVAQVPRARGLPTLAFSVASNPEFLKEGSAVQDFMRPDRVVVGADDPQTAQTLHQLYAPFMRNVDRLIVMNVRSAEFTKYAANAMLATRISFMNELANLAEKLGADIESVRKGIGSDPRIGYDFLYAGAGYGGSCFPKDVKALIKTARVNAGIDLKVLNAVEAANDAQKHVLAEKVKARFGDDLAGRHFGLWGLAFKANTDDMREATSREVIKDLLAAGATVTAYDPVAIAESRHCFPDEPRLAYAESQAGALENADALVIVTEWKEFRSPDFNAIKAKLKTPVIFDGRNLFEPAEMRRLGITYYGIGR